MVTRVKKNEAVLEKRLRNLEEQQRDVEDRERNINESREMKSKSTVFNCVRS
jgi:hypothetical protein